MVVIDTIKNKKYSVELKCGGVEFYENKCKNVCKILELTDLLKDKNIYHLKFIIQNNKYEEEDSKNSAELIITSIDNDGTLYKQNILFYYYDILENIKITKPQFDFENLTLIIPTLNQNINANGLIYNLNFKHNKEKDNYTWECFVKQINN